MKYLILFLCLLTPALSMAKSSWKNKLITDLLKTESDTLEQDSMSLSILNNIIEKISLSNNTQSPLKNMNEQYSSIKNKINQQIAIENKRFALLNTPSRIENEKTNTDAAFFQLDTIIKRINVHYKVESALIRIEKIMPEYQ